MAPHVTGLPSARVRAYKNRAESCRIVQEHAKPCNIMTKYNIMQRPCKIHAKPCRVQAAVDIPLQLDSIAYSLRHSCSHSTQPHSAVYHNDRASHSSPLAEQLFKYTPSPSRSPPRNPAASSINSSMHTSPFSQLRAARGLSHRNLW